MHFKNELQNIISGIGQNAEGNLVQAAANYLRESQKTSGSAETVKLSKDEEATKLIQWANANNLYAEVGVFTDRNQNACY